MEHQQWETQFIYLKDKSQATNIKKENKQAFANISKENAISNKDSPGASSNFWRLPSDSLNIIQGMTIRQKKIHRSHTDFSHWDFQIQNPTVVYLQHNLR